MSENVARLAETFKLSSVRPSGGWASLLRRPLPALALVCVPSMLLLLAVEVFNPVLYVVFSVPAYLTLHTLAELASIIISFSIFTVNWQASRQSRNAQSLFIGVAFLIVAVVDTMHTLSFNGMPDFVTPNSVGKAIVYWITARLTEAFALLVGSQISPQSRNRLLRQGPLLAVGLLLPAVVFVAVTYFWDYIPAMYVNGQGLTPLKVGLEYLVVALNLVAIGAYWRVYRRTLQRPAVVMMQALAVVIFAELAFTLYLSAYDTYNFLGHVFKVVAYYLIFRALFVTSIEDPHLRLRKANEELSALVATSGEVASTLDLRAICQSVVEHCRELTGARWGFLDFVDNGKLQFSTVQQDDSAQGGAPVDLQQRADVFRRLYGDMLLGGQGVNSQDVGLDLAKEGLSGDVAQATAFLGIPLEAKGRLMGFVGLCHMQKEFGADDQRLVTALASQAAMAINNAMLYEQTDEALGRKVKDLAALETVTEAGLTALRLQDLLSTLIRRMVEAGEAHCGVIFLLEEGTGYLVPRASFGLKEEVVAEFKLKIGEGFVGQIAQTGVHLAVPDAQNDDRVRSNYLRNQGIRSMLGVPLKSADRVIGVVHVDFLEVREFSPEEIRRFHVLADRAAIAIEKAQLQQLKDEYVSLITHDLRSPLTVMLGQSQLLEKSINARGDEREIKSAKALVDGARRLNAMIADLLETSRLESGRLEMQKEPVWLPGLVGDVVEGISVAAPEYHLRCEFSEDLPTILADRKRLERVVANLITNGVKYSPEGSEIVVRIHWSGDEIITSVKDDGVGVSPEDIPHLFERFYRAKSGKKAEGLGLGLYITRMLVEAHGGRICAESKEGEGSVFSFVLPITG